MTKPTKAELYAEVSKLEDKLIELECQLETAAIDAEKTVQQLLNQYNAITKITQERNELEAANYRERDAGAAAFHRYADHLAKLKRQLNRANWYVATMFLATVSMAAMAAVAIFV